MRDIPVCYQAYGAVWAHLLKITDRPSPIIIHQE